MTVAIFEFRDSGRSTCFFPFSKSGCSDHIEICSGYYNYRILRGAGVLIGGSVQGKNAGG